MNDRDVCLSLHAGSAGSFLSDVEIDFVFCEFYSKVF